MNFAQDNDPTQFTVPPAVLYAIFIVVALHELSHALTKFLFGETVITPLGLGMDHGQVLGESGQVLEQNIMGGVLLGEWEEAHRGDVRKMLRLILLEALPAPFARAWDLGQRFYEANFPVTETCQRFGRGYLGAWRILQISGI